MKKYAALFALILPWSAAQAARLEPQVSFSTIQFATEATQSSRFDVNLDWRSSESLAYDNKQIPRWQFGLVSFVESGKQGDWSADPIRGVWRFSSRRNAHFWLGRTLPQDENFEESGPSFAPQTAVGSLWSQNQTSALDARVSGWVGGGWSGKIGRRTTLTAAASPIFVPSFGHSLGLKDFTRSNSARFSRFPAQSIELQGQRYPLRHELSFSDYQKHLFKPQLYLGANFEQKESSTRVMAWTAPNPHPQLNTSAGVKLEEQANGQGQLAVGTPDFKRQAILAVAYKLKRRTLQPEVQIAYEFLDQATSVSAGLTAFSFVHVGLLHSFNRDQAYSNRLLWARLQTPQASEFYPSLKFERHFTPGRVGTWLQPEVQYIPSRNLGFFAQVSLLAGQPTSYFGNWRDKDSVSLGARYQW